MHLKQHHATVAFEEVTCRRGSRIALADIDISINCGEVFGLVGPNGAGKTTMIDLCCGLLRATAGRLLVLGDDPSRRDSRLRRRVGVVPQETALYEELDCTHNLRFSARLYHVPQASTRIEDMLKLVGLWDRRHERVATLSGGMKRRLAIARALLHNPELLILDEPTLGVDVDARHQIWQHVRGLAREGRTVLLSTNYLDEASALCDRIAFLRNGRLVAVDSPSSLLALAGRCLDIVCGDDEADQLALELKASDGVLRVARSIGGLTLHLESGPYTDALAEGLFTRLGTGRVRARAPDLAEVFEILVPD